MRRAVEVDKQGVHIATASREPWGGHHLQSKSHNNHKKTAKAKQEENFKQNERSLANITSPGSMMFLRQQTTYTTH